MDYVHRIYINFTYISKWRINCVICVYTFDWIGNNQTIVHIGYKFGMCVQSESMAAKQNANDYSSWLVIYIAIRLIKYSQCFAFLIFCINRWKMLNKHNICFFSPSSLVLSSLTRNVTIMLNSLGTWKNTTQFIGWRHKTLKRSSRAWRVSNREIKMNRVNENEIKRLTMIAAFIVATKCYNM